MLAAARSPPTTAPAPERKQDVTFERSDKKLTVKTIGERNVNRLGRIRQLKHFNCKRKVTDQCDVQLFVCLPLLRK